MGSLEGLLELQQVDLARDRLIERKETLPAKTELSELEQRMKEVQGAIERVDGESLLLAREVDRLEAEVRQIDEKIAQEEEKLYSGRVVNPKELSALQDEIAMLKRRRQPFEEQEMEKLVRRDELADERKALEAELDDLGGEADSVRQKIDALTAEIDAELSVEDAKRAELVGALPTEVVEDYEELRERKRGIGVGALENGICTACREALSAVEIDRIKRKAREGEELFRCEHCRRLLVLT